jgi:penicillin-binding protein 1C
VLKQSPPREAKALITTLDLDLQEACERLAKSHLQRLKRNRVTNTALVVMENRTGEILAMVGSADYFNAEIDGQYNVATGSRQPGSALKPFTYALSLEGDCTPATLLPDLPLPFQVQGRYDESHANRCGDVFSAELRQEISRRSAFARSVGVFLQTSRQ